MCKTLCDLKDSEFCETCKGYTKDIYGMEQWSKDGTFNAEPMQEISADVYNEFFGSLPPIPIPSSLGMCGFMNSEPYTHAIDSKGRYTAFYACFGKIKDHYYYLGLVNRAGEKTIK